MNFTKQQIEEAREMGREAGRAAASWTTDGNTDPAGAERLLRMLDDGDPEAYDYLPRRPNLSGEDADGPTPLSLARDVGVDAAAEDAPAELDALAEAWEEGVNETFESGCESALRACLDDAEAGRQVTLVLTIPASDDLADLADRIAEMSGVVSVDEVHLEKMTAEADE